jgi:hypothetical protein
VDEPLLAYCVHPDSMYHDPTGVAREISALRRKYSDLPEGDSFAPDLAHWHVRLARMAHSLGDGRTAVRLIRAGVAEAGVVPVGRQLLHRLVGKAQRTSLDGPAVAEPGRAWLRAYEERTPAETSPGGGRDG